MDPIYVGQIMLWPTTWAPYGWVFCNGASYTTAQYQGLFSLIGYTYGGSGTVFSVPNLAGITLAGTGVPQSPLRQKYQLSNTQNGSTVVSLKDGNTGAHNHLAAYNFSSNGLQASVVASASAATASTPINNSTLVPAAGCTNDSSVPADLYGAVASPITLTNAISASLTPTFMSMKVLPSMGTNSEPHNNMQPYLSFNYIIAVLGIYPPFS